MTKAAPIRELVLAILLEVMENEQYSHQVINQTLKKYQYLEKQDRAFLSRLAEGTIEHQIRLDYVIEQFSSVKIRKMKPVIRNLLRMGAYQILFMDGVPDSAACNEAVKLAEKKGFRTLKGFVNGVLRNISRNKDTLNYPSEKKEPVQYLSVMYSMPSWIITDWMKEYEYAVVKGMLDRFLVNRPVSIRCNLSKISPEELQANLIQSNVDVEQSPYLPYALRISGYDYISQLPGFAEGHFQVQDESSMFVAEVAGIQKDDLVIDVCAAPGGKSLHASDKLAGSGMVIARDLTENKVAFIEENCARLGSTNVKAQVHDALVLDEELIGKADVVFADLPCSGLGVIGKKTDIKYKMNPEKQKDLVALQREMLAVVAQYVKKGGTLIYSTCTINIEENQNNVEWFVANHPFELESLDPFLPDSLKSETTSKGYLQFIPGIQETDGFFVARLKAI